MKYLFTFILTVLFAAASIAQNEMPNPIKWSAKSIELEDGSLAIEITADIEEEWHLYSQFTEEGGPIPTEFTFFTEEIELIEGVEETLEAEKKFSDMFDLNVVQYEDKAVFIQKYKNIGATSIKGEVYFMTCDGLRCLPPKAVEFEVEL